MTTAKLATGAVNVDKLADDSVSEAKIINDAVTENKIKDDSISHNKMKVNAVNSIAGKDYTAKDNGSITGSWVELKHIIIPANALALGDSLEVKAIFDATEDQNGEGRLFIYNYNPSTLDTDTLVDVSGNISGQNEIIELISEIFLNLSTEIYHESKLLEYDGASNIFDIKAAQKSRVTLVNTLLPDLEIHVIVYGKSANVNDAMNEVLQVNIKRQL